VPLLHATTGEQQLLVVLGPYWVHVGGPHLLLLGAPVPRLLSHAAVSICNTGLTGMLALSTPMLRGAEQQQDLLLPSLCRYHMSC
jgi:hypothetical protein